MHKITKIFNQDHFILSAYCLRRYMQEMGWSRCKDVIINIQDMYDSVLYPEYGIILKTNFDLGEYEGRKVLGKSIFNEKTILIDKSITNKNNPEIALIIAHEVAHLLIHTEQDTLHPYTAEKTIFNEYFLNEMCADHFARNLIMPSEFVAYRFIQLYGMQTVYTGPGDYCINQTSVSILSLLDFCQKLAEPLTHYFSNVSKDELGYRLRSLIKDTTVDPKDKNKMVQLAPNFYASHNFVEECNRG